MINDDEQLDQLLNSLSVPPINSQLKQNIIEQTKESGRVSQSVIRQLINNLMIPKPSYALACSMLLGILLGWQVMSELTVESYSTEEEISSLFLAEVSFYE